jgi:hypothetical protein
MVVSVNTSTFGLAVMRSTNRSKVLARSDRDSRKAALARSLRKAEGKEESRAAEEERLAA